MDFLNLKVLQKANTQSYQITPFIIKCDQLNIVILQNCLSFNHISYLIIISYIDSYNFPSSRRLLIIIIEIIHNFASQC